MIHRGIRRIRRRKRARWFALAGTFCAFVLSGSSAPLIGYPAADFLCGASGIVGLTAILVLQVLWASSRCPRCGKFFYLIAGGLVGIPFVRSCVHCGLRLSGRNQLTREDYEKLRSWLMSHSSCDGIPEVGLHCETCGYALTGLLEDRCPECGKRFSIERIIQDCRATIK